MILLFNCKNKNILKSNFNIIVRDHMYTNSKLLF